MQALGAEPDNTDLYTPLLFQSYEPLSLRIVAPFKTIHRYRGRNRPYSPAMMELADIYGNEVQLDVRISVRGNFRSDLVTCKYPPLKLNFDRDLEALKNTVFKGENILKLVVQCRDQEKYKHYLILEYLNYRVFQLLSVYSLNVRLAQIDYYDSERNRDTGNRIAFFIEDTGRFGDRLNLEELEVKKMRTLDYDPARLNLAEMFEFFIANTDWSATSPEKDENCCHNLIPFQDQDGSIIPVPYDFDLAGVVDAPYAVVNPGLRIKTVRQRLYRGHCQDDAILQSTLAIFRSKRKEIYSLYENQSGLPPETIKQTIKYFDIFYDVIQDEEKLKWMILNKCR